jgi:hypothetical protein
MPARPATHDCLVPDCPEPGRNQLGVRCRVAHSGASPFPHKRRTDAIFSVESAGYLCDRHSLAGGTMHLSFEPNLRRQATVVASSGEREVEERTKPIGQPETAIAA